MREITCSICGAIFAAEPKKKVGGRLYFDSRCLPCKALQSRRYKQKPRAQFVQARSIAKGRGIEFTLTEEEYTALRSLPCHYCGFDLPPSGMGIDRKDERGAYCLGNVVPCCTDCNLAKNASFSYEEMLVIGRAVRRVKLHRRQRGETRATRLGVPRRHFPVPDRPDRVRRQRIAPEVVRGVIAARTEERLSLGQIGRRYDLDKGTVHDILKRHGVPARIELASPTPSGQRGEQHHGAKLTAELVRQIRAASAAGFSQSALAKRFGVCQGAIHKVLSGKSWSHVV